MKVHNLAQLYERIPEDQFLILDVLRTLVIETLGETFKEKISFNVPYFYGKKGICLIWPAAIPRGGFKSGVLLGFWRGNELEDLDQYLTHGTNKKIFYKIYQSVDEIDVDAVIKLLQEAKTLDQS